MKTREFHILPRGTIFRIPGEPQVYIKSEVYYEGKLQELPYDGKHTIILPEDIPESAKVESSLFLYRARPTNVGVFQETIKKNGKNSRRLTSSREKRNKFFGDT